ncbi:MAG: DsbA family protein [Gemmatimonadaceae bacterium]
MRPDTFGARVDSARNLGSASAPLWVVVVSDFQCDECRAFANTVLPALRRDFVARGVVRLGFVNFPQERHFNARFAAHAALCAASAGRFWEMHDALFAELPRWDRMSDPQPFMDSLAVSVGVPSEVQTSCTTRQRLLRLLGDDIERSHAAGVTELPTVFVGDSLLPMRERTAAGVRRAVERALRQRRS